jgi:NitT/TauT family transport system substrate-binding protein
MTTTISMENVFPFQDLAVLVAHHEGLFAEEGLAIEFVKTPGLWQVPVDHRVTDPEGLSSRIGHASGCEVGTATLYNACEWGNYRRAQDSDVGARQVGRRASIAYGAIIVAPWSPVFTAPQLHSVPVGVPYYNGTHYLALQMLEGFLPRDAIKTCQAPLMARERYGALMRRELDATTVVEPYITVAEKAGCRVLVEAGFHGTEVASGALDTATYAAFKRAVRRAIQRINADKRGYARYFIDYHRDDPDVAALTVDDFSLRRIQVGDFGPIPEGEFKATYDWMVSWNLIRRGHAADTLIDLDRQREAHTLVNQTGI